VRRGFTIHFGGKTWNKGRDVSVCLFLSVTQTRNC